MVRKEFKNGDEHWSAVYSPCERYRYSLERIWDPHLRPCQFIGLNPSTATEVSNDRTVKRCMDYARLWGYGGLIMSNIFAWRDTDPRDMKAADEPVGEENDLWLKDDHLRSGITIFAWGNHGTYRGRCYEVADLIPSGHALKVTKEGHPIHPLYQRKDAKPSLFWGYQK